MKFISIITFVPNGHPPPVDKPTHERRSSQTTPEQLLEALESAEMQAHLQANPADAARFIKAAGGDSGFQHSLANIKDPE